ncbi:MAG: RNA-binding transcriptional accessory protein [Clostridia bacterium]|nr:RNA-binding transcriptional accessory protein [Clostridia bacterium]
MDYAKQIAEQFGTKEIYIKNIIDLLDEGNTIPFIARYRKEMHGTMDDQKIREISDRLKYLRGLDERREEVKNLITEQGNMTDEILAALDKATVLAEIEDIYRPFRPKRKTRASVAKEKGLEPLANEILENQNGEFDLTSVASQYIDAEKGVETAEDAIAGAMDIIAENVSDNADVRRRVRNIIRLNGFLCSTAAKDAQNSVYEMYYTYREPITRVAGHRVLAINRGEKEEFLKVGIEIENDKPMNVIFSLFVKGDNDCAECVKNACLDAYTRLVFPSIEREIRNELTDTASTAAIKVFGVNLRQLLMQPPIKNKVTIGLDPGYRTGCKVAVVDGNGKVLDTAVIYPTHSETQIEKSKAVLTELIKKHNVDIIAIGNGTASKETEMFTVEVISKLDKKISYMVVNEAGASVYSASPLAAAEMPDFDLTLRSAVSIARRLQDPLAELVKIEPKARGVGQYQHDMPKKELEEALDGVVEACVNNVGADLNSASAALLSHIAGLSATVCKNIVAYREENGSFEAINELKKVSKLGPKAYEQCAGFLRIANAKNPLDNTGVHPESYAAATKLLNQFGYTLDDVKNRNIGELDVHIEKVGAEILAQKIGIGVPTLLDIAKELAKPGRDPREELPPPLLRTDVMSLEDLKVGMELKGTVRNVIDFGAFIDIGVHQDGLVHISQICDKFIRHPGEVLSVGDVVKVKVIGVDTAKNRISLTMKGIN